MKHTSEHIANTPAETPSAQEIGDAKMAATDNLTAVRVHTMRTLESSTRDEQGPSASQPVPTIQELAIKLIAGAQQSGAYSGSHHPGPGQIDPQLLIDALNRSMALRPGIGGFGRYGEAFSGATAPIINDHGHAPRNQTATPTMRHPELKQHNDAASAGHAPRQPFAADNSARELPGASTATVDRRTEEQQIAAVVKAITELQERALARDTSRPARGEDTPAIKPAEGSVKDIAINLGNPLRAVETSHSSSIVTPSIQAALNETRNDSARLINQILSGDFLQRAVEQSQQLSEQPQPLDPSLSAGRLSVSTRLEQLRDNLQTILEQTTPRQSSGDNAMPSPPGTTAQVVGDFTRTEAPSRATVQTNDLAREDRSRDATRPAPGDGPTSSASASRGAAQASSSRERFQERGPDGKPFDPQRSSGTDQTTAPTGQLTNERSLLDSITKLTGKLTSIEVLRKIDSALETTVIAAAAAATLGVMGGEILTKRLVELGRELLRYLNKEEVEDLSPEEIIAEIEEMCSDRDVEALAKPAEMVSDISGAILQAENGQPIEGTIVDAGPLGSTITDINGVFIFKNVPLESGYTLAFIDNRYVFNPPSVVGTVSTINHHSITATPKD